ncbi:hypothetical protein [Acrocarpospora sp. B8E8]|uniref:hypothetical protein n=1 Tax=Acrocarpospora sp. B8E8 TaxID=3153572 RepID=UPI00325FB633
MLMAHGFGGYRTVREFGRTRSDDDGEASRLAHGAEDDGHGVGGAVADSARAEIGFHR